MICGMLGLCLGEHVHAVLVELLHAPREIAHIECVALANPEVRDFEIEPIGIATRVRVHLHQDIVLCSVVDVDRVNVAAFKVLIECKNFVLVNVAWEPGVEILLQVIDHVLGSIVR